MPVYQQLTNRETRFTGVLGAAEILQLVPRLASRCLRESRGERVRPKSETEEKGPAEGQIQATVYCNALARSITFAHTGVCQSSE